MIRRSVRAASAILPIEDGRLSGRDKASCVNSFSSRRLFLSNGLDEAWREESIERGLDVGTGFDLILVDKDRDDLTQHCCLLLTRYRRCRQHCALGKLKLGDVKRKLGFVGQNLGGLVRVVQDPLARSLVGGQHAADIIWVS